MPSFVGFKASAGITIKDWVSNILWLLVSTRKGIHLLKFSIIASLYVIMLTMHGGGTPKVPRSQHQYLPTLKRKPWTLKKIECTCAGMMRKSLDVQFGIPLSTWNVGSVLGKLGEIFQTLKRCCVHICCLQEIRLKGERTKMIGNGFEFLWSGGCKAE